MGITSRVSRYETIYGGDSNRIHNVQLVARLVDRKLIAPGSTFSFNQTTGARTADKGFLEAPVIINGELEHRPRRRRLPGLDDRLQRRLRGRPEDHLAHEPRALHQPLPAGPRRDGELPGRRPEVRQRHRPLAAAAHVRRLVLARVDLYGAPLHRRVESETRAARRHGRRAGEADPRPEPVRGRDRRSTRAARPRSSTSVRRQVYRAPARCSTTTRGTRPTAARPRVVRVGTKPKPKPKQKIGPTGPTPGGPSGPTGVDRRQLLSGSDLVRQPGRHARRPVRGRVHAGVSRPPVGDLLRPPARSK